MQIGPIEKAIDDSFMWGQIDILMYILNINQDHPPSYTFGKLLLSGTFEQKRDELFWKYTCWCLAHNIAVGALCTRGRWND